MQGKIQTLVYGFAIFAMFFGSGNLVFPLQIGLNVSPYWFSGSLGLFITGITLPFLGLFVIKLHHGKYEDFFAEGGRLAQFVLPLFTLSLLGSFGVVPRCITVAHGGIEALFPEFPLSAFSIAFCNLCFLICLKDHWVISILGKWMTPLLLISLIFLIALGVWYAPALDHPTSCTRATAFQEGFLGGYQTMDLFAAFFFSALTFKHIQSSMPKHSSPKQVIRKALVPSVIGASLLAAIYLGFVFLGAHYAPLIPTVAPELLLPTIAKAVLGEKATLWIGIIVVFSCLTTAVALNNIYARYLCTLFKLKSNFYYTVALFLTTLCSFLVSLLDFKGIAAFLVPLLEVSYPSFIVLTFLGIALKRHHWIKKIAFYLVLFITILLTFYY